MIRQLDLTMAMAPFQSRLTLIQSVMGAFAKHLPKYNVYIDMYNLYKIMIMYKTFLYKNQKVKSVLRQSLSTLFL